MKKLFITLILFGSFLITTAQPGRVKIYFNGFVCDRETWDDILHLDGKCDEVFLTFQISVADANGNTKLTYEYKTPTYGDAIGSFGNRISAGSCVDLFGGAKGGIRGGDRYLTNDLIGEFDIASTDLVSVVPVLWEWDPEQVVVDPLLSALKSATATISRETAKLSGSTSGAFSPVVSTINDVSKFIFPANIFMVPDFFNVIQTVVGKQGTRPVGMTAQGNFAPKVMVLSPQLMTNNARINMGYGSGVIPVKYFETELGNEREHGNYLVLMRAEFAPSATTTTTATATPVMLQGTVMPQTVTYQTVTATPSASQEASPSPTTTSTTTSTTNSSPAPAATTTTTTTTTTNQTNTSGSGKTTTSGNTTKPKTGQKTTGGKK